LRGAPDRVRIRQGDQRAIMLTLRARDTVILERVAHRREVYR
jgi:mRNA-degrading endonuclease RelE of RelBE toxin-antitoxin system